MTKAIRDSNNVDNEIFNEAADGRDKNLINALCLAVLFASGLIGYGVFIVLFYFTENYIISISGGSGAFLFIYQHDRGLLLVISKKIIYSRMLLSLLLAGSLFSGVKGIKSKDHIIQQIIIATDEKNHAIENELNDELEQIEIEETAVVDQFLEGAKEARKNWYAYSAGKTARDKFLEDKPARIQRLEDRYAEMKMEPDTSKLGILEFHFGQTLSGEFSSRSYLNIILVFMLLLVEASPSIFRLAIDGGKYLKAVDRKKQNKERKDQNIRILEDSGDKIERQIIEEEEGEIEELLLRQEYINEKKKLAESGFKDLSRLFEITDAMKALKAQKNPTPKASRAKSNNHGKQNGKHQPEKDEFPGFNYDNA